MGMKIGQSLGANKLRVDIDISGSTTPKWPAGHQKKHKIEEARLATMHY